MYENIEDNGLLSKVIDLCLTYEIKDSELYLKFLDNQIKFYQHQIEFLANTKPLFFQKKKLEEHNKKVEECEEKIKNAYLKMGEEVDMIIKMKNSINR